MHPIGNGLVKHDLVNGRWNSPCRKDEEREKEREKGPRIVKSESTGGIVNHQDSIGGGFGITNKTMKLHWARLDKSWGRRWCSYTGRLSMNVWTSDSDPEGGDALVRQRLGKKRKSGVVDDRDRFGDKKIFLYSRYWSGFLRYFQRFLGNELQVTILFELEAWSLAQLNNPGQE